MQSFGKHCTTSQLEIPNESMVFEAPSSSEVQGGSRLFMLTRNDYDTQTILGKFLVDCHESPRLDSQRIHACKHETGQCAFASTSLPTLFSLGGDRHIAPVFEHTEGRFLGLRISNPFSSGNESFNKHLGLGFMTNGHSARMLYIPLAPASVV
mgnify:CR=1 FL=1